MKRVPVQVVDVLRLYIQETFLMVVPSGMSSTRLVFTLQMVGAVQLHLRSVIKETRNDALLKRVTDLVEPAHYTW